MHVQERPVRTLEDLRDYAQREGKEQGTFSCLWADNFAIEVIAKYFRLDILFVDMERKLGTNPYRVLARGGEGARKR
jgi:hypothetical protein